MNNITTIALYEWTKRLGQKHFTASGSTTTLCGKPMLGNNYASDIADNDKTVCQDCKTVIKKIEEG